MPRQAISPIGVSVVQRRAQMAEQIAKTAISGVGRVEEEMQHARSVAEAAIAEAAAASSRMESNVAHVVAQMEAKTVQAVTALAKRVHESVVETGGMHIAHCWICGPTVGTRNRSRYDGCGRDVRNEDKISCGRFARQNQGALRPKSRRF